MSARAATGAGVWPHPPRGHNPRGSATIYRRKVQTAQPRVSKTPSVGSIVTVVGPAVMSFAITASGAPLVSDSRAQ